MRIISVTLTLVSALALASCGNGKVSETFDYGTFSNGVYTNDFLGMRMEIPGGWYWQDQDIIRQEQQAANDLILENGVVRDAVTKVADVKTATLVWCGKSNDQTDEDYNIRLSVENVKGRTVKDVHSYISMLLKTMEQMNMPYNTFDPIVTTKNIGGHEFSSFALSIDVGSMILQQEFDIMIYKGFAVVFNLTYADAEQLTELEKVMSTVRFE